MNYHITAKKKISECKCNPCRAKYGTWGSKEAAEAALEALKTAGTPTPPIPRDVEEEAAVEPSMEDDEVARDLEGESFPEEPEPSVNLLNKKARVTPEAYFDDDLEFLKAEDKLLSASPDSVLVEQDENLVSWHLENFFDAEGNRRSRHALRSSPPVLVIKASDGSEAEFLLTKNLSATLNETFEMVNRGFYGVDPKRKNSLTQEPKPTKKEVMVSQWEDHPIRTVLLALMVVVVVVSAFIL